MTRKRNTKDINKEKINFKRKIRIYFSKLFHYAKLLIISLFIILSIIKLIKNGKEYFYDKIKENTSDLLSYKLEKVYIKGQKNLKTSYITSVLNADIGTPLLAINLKKLNEDIEKNSWVKNSYVRRELPNKIHINIEEREPIAIWQEGKKNNLIDKYGFVIDSDNLSYFSDLIHIVGKGANIHAFNLIDEINRDKNLKSKILTAVRYGERRWDLIFQGDLTIKMPQTDPETGWDFEKAWKYLSDLNKKDKLFSQEYKVIDLRIKDKFYFKK